MQGNSLAALDTSLRSEPGDGSRERTANESRGKLVLEVPRGVAHLNSNCVVCGKHNSHGLHLAFEGKADGVHALWIPIEGWKSFRSTVHGGIIAAVLDEAMSKAIIVCGWEAFTAELRLRFRERL